MRRRFGRGRRGRSAGDAKIAPIDAARWFERLTGEGIVPAGALEPVDAEDVPASFAVLGIGDTEDGERIVVGFAPRHGGDSALATLAHAQRLAAEEGFQGEAIAVAPQWTIAARRRLALLGELPFRFRAIAASSLGEEGGAVEVEPVEAPLAGPADQMAAELERIQDRELFLRALSAFEGLAAKHGGAVRGAVSGAELLLLTRRVALLRATEGKVTLETLLPERSSLTLKGVDFAAAMDRLEGQLRRHLNDRRVQSSEEGTRAKALPALGEAAGLRAMVRWPLGGSDPEILDLAGIDAEGRPVVAAVRHRLTLAGFAAILDAALALRSSLPLLFAGAAPPLRLGALRLALVGEAFDDAVLRVLSALSVDHAIYELRTGRPGGPEVLLREAASGAPARRTPPREAGSARGRQRRGSRAALGAAEPEEAAAAGGEAEEVEPPRFEEVSLFDLEDDLSPAEEEARGEEAPRPRRRRRGRRRGRRAALSDEAKAVEAAPFFGDEAELVDAQPSRLEGPSDASEEEDRVEALLGADLEHDPSATLAPLDDEVPEIDEPLPAYDDEEEFDEEVADLEIANREAWAQEREARHRARLAKISPEPPREEPPAHPRRRSAIVAHADRDAVAAAVLLARDIRLIEGFWVYPQSELMNFFRTVATDLRAETPIYVVGFTARPARDTIQAAALYSGRLGWYDHHDWPPEDLEALREAIGPENVNVEPGSGSSLPAVLARRTRRSRFSDKVVELLTGRFTQHDYERWGRLWWHRLGEIAEQPGERRSAIDLLLAGRPSDLAKEAADAAAPPAPPEVAYVAERDFRVVHFGGHTLVVVPVPDELNPHLTARAARERLGAQVSLAHRERGELVVLGADETRGRRALDLGAMVAHLAAKHDWIDALTDDDCVARMRVRELTSQPGRLDELVAEVAMGRSILEG